MKGLNAENLKALGVDRLAEILMDVSAVSTAIKRRLRLELAGTEGSGAVANEIRKRLTTIARSRSFFDWQNRKELIEDLETQRRAIVEQVAKHDPAEGLELIFRFMALANSIFERCDDSGGSVIDIFHTACIDLGEMAKAAKIDRKELADRVFQALIENDYGQYDDLIAVSAQPLGQEGLEHLKKRMMALSKEPVRKVPENERRVIGWGTGGAIYADELEERSRTGTVRLALQEIADVQGDVDGYIGQYDEQTRKVPRIAAEIAQRLLAHGRTDEAWRAINAAEPRREGWPEFEWEDVRIGVLDALGRTDEAQSARLSCFERFLSAPHLQAYLKRLPEFDDFEAEGRALDYAQKYKSLLRALSFLVAWPALDKAANLVIQRGGELDGDHYEVLTPAADALAGKYPLAATLLLRAMIDFSLTKSRSSRYRHAARHLLECESLASSITNFMNFENHETYAKKLRTAHGRKTSFWSLIS